MKHGKKYEESIKLVDSAKLYDVEEAFDVVVKTATAKFDESIETHIRLGVDSRHADQQVRGVVVLPHGTGKTQRVLVFAKGPKAEEAKKAGAEFVGDEDLMNEILNGKNDFDRVVATPDMMGVVGRLGKVLGPRGLMPNPKLGTVTMDVAGAVKAVKAGQVQFRADAQGIVHAVVGKASFDADKLVENVKAFVDAINKAKPTGVKGVYLKKVALSSTQGAGVKVTLTSVV